ncbi:MULTISPECIES: ParA family protein [Burkholderia]|uniref:ParA family protein n=1 Tax=Burkholderia TaxID=32008 RepID=UPI0005724C0F|nr:MULTISPECIES: ParA family protein [Burkholderia]ANW49675.1 ATPase [Burkholderia pseudomallei]ANW55700.1 ATPase [Burkholderia pseudomallei]MBF3561525.1 ParA family protein [Burkholderia pseudomallei]MBO2952203.1 ParA family protein [Burkholderia pseudomallei]MBO2982318.1 ParA family protein [Burkholderia pseudomallei]
MDIRYAFWNNKGGTGKTSLAFQAIAGYAEAHPQRRVLAVDMCPQANLSELMLGGLNNRGSERLLQLQHQAPRCTIGGYFQARLPAPYSMPAINPADFITRACQHNASIPSNIHLVCGDPLLELQSNAVNTLANNQIPGTNAWIRVIDWLNDFLSLVSDDYDTVFIDCNPSFSMYTQIALSSVQRLVLPVMADDSSRRALQNAFSLVYGLQLPSAIYAAYAFGTKLTNEGRQLPKVHLIAKNRLTQYMGAASAYSAVLAAIDGDVGQLLRTNPDIFDFADPGAGFVEVRDFQTTGVVAFAKGLPFSQLATGRQSVNGQRVDVKADYLKNARNAMAGLVAKL